VQPIHRKNILNPQHLVISNLIVRNGKLNPTLKIFSPHQSKRLDFVLDLIFKQLLGLHYEIVEKPEFAQVVYGASAQQEKAISIPRCHNLLFNAGFEPIEVSVKNLGAETELFPIENGDPKSWSFDLFSAVFYLVSRYEEYSGFEPDTHKRFPPETSILHKTQSFEFPLVNIWVQKLKSELLYKWPDLNIVEPRFQFISTIDVDSTFQFKEKDLLWSLKGFLNDVINGKFSLAINRVSTLLGLKKDAFDVFDEIEILHKKLKTKVKYFFLLGDYGPFDKNIPWPNTTQADLIRKLSLDNEIGIHPSYASNTKNFQLIEECQRFEKIIGVPPKISRQHFLVHKFPLTYQKLIRNGITEDHTLGFTSQYGFRAGIASPFYFYDLQKEEITNLLLYPFCSMDITPLHYYKLTPEQAKAKNLELLNRVHSVNGTFISLWHNESLSGELRWKGTWRSVYEQLIVDAANISARS
jgi:hypothetical protein